MLAETTDPQGVLVIDDFGFLKKGRNSVLCGQALLMRHKPPEKEKEAVMKRFNDFWKGNITRNIGFILIATALVFTGCGDDKTYVSVNPADPEHWYSDQYHVAVLSDMHIPPDPGTRTPYQEAAIQTFNSWADLDMVVVAGDNVDRGGTAEAEVEAKLLLDKLFAPYRVVGGNHDYLYDDLYTPNLASGHTLKQGPESRIAKLEVFKTNWGLEKLWYSERLGNYLFVFMTPDGLNTNNYCEVTDNQLDWFSAELAANKNTPTIVVFHCPLTGTKPELPPEIQPDGNIFLDSDFAEPASKIKTILLANKQVFMWVSGHTHTQPTTDFFNSPLNLYENQVMNIYNPNFNSGATIWTNSLFLKPDMVIVRTYNHKEKRWMEEQERTIAIPQL